MHNDKSVVSLHLFGFDFTPKILPTLLTVLLIPLFISLGIWQLHRADFKAAMLKELETRKHQAPLTLSDLDQPKAKEFSPVALKGHFDSNHQLLVQNQFYNHRIGYQVLTPLQLEDSSVVLVNRGWVPKHSTNFNVEELRQTVKGFILLPHQHIFSLGKPAEQKQWPKLIPNNSWEQIHRAYTIRKLRPFVVMADAGQTFSYQPNYQATTVSPQKHMGYAVQWFGFAIALFVIFIAVNTRRRKS